MFERPLFIYSNFCNYCNKFIDTLSENVELAEAFLTLCIDVVPSTGSRPPAFYEIQKELNYNITEVPTIIVDQGKYVLSGEEAFKWLKYTIEKKSKKELTAFNPNEMFSFSDQYSPYGSTEMTDASEQSFRFVNKSYEGIETPAEGSIQSVADYEKVQKDRDLSYKMMPRPNGTVNMTFQQDFSKMGSKRGRGVGSQKQQEIDDRLQQLIAQREEFTPARHVPKNIDFSNMKR